MNTDLLRSFLEVARQESYTKAAQNLYLGQPTVYQHVRALEKLLRTQLVRQAGKRVVVTAEGRVVLEQAIRVLSAENHLLTSTLLDQKELRTGQLEIVAGSTFGMTVVPLALAAFKVRFPGISVRVEVHHNPEEIDRLLLSFGHDGGFHSNGVSRPKLLKDRVIRDDLILVVPTTHPLRHLHRAATAMDLVAESLICYGSPYGVRAAIDAWAEAQKCLLPTQFELDSQNAIVNMVAANGGTAIVSTLTALPFLKGGDVAGIPLQPPLSRWWYLVRMADREVPRALTELIQDMNCVVEHAYLEAANLVSANTSA